MVPIPTYLIDGSSVCRRQPGVVAWLVAILLLSSGFFLPIRAVMHTAFCCQESSERSVPCEETDSAEDALWASSEQARRRTPRRVGRTSVASMAFALHDLPTNRQRRTGLPLQERYYLLSGLLASLRL